MGATSPDEKCRADAIFQTKCAAKARRRPRRINCANWLKIRAQFCMYMEDLAVAYLDLSPKRANASRADWPHLYAACEQS